jgi:hypothetical protein
MSVNSVNLILNFGLLSYFFASTSQILAVTCLFNLKLLAVQVY